MITHELKTWPEYFQEVLNGNKTFEIRENDRNFQIGDKLVLKEFNPKSEEYTKREVVKFVSYITDFNQAKNHVVLGLSENKPAMQVLKIIYEDGSVAHYTGAVQRPRKADAAVAHFHIFEIEEPRNMVAEALAICRNTLATIKKEHLSDAQRVEMLDKAIDKLDSAGS